jgi:PST family polysaccharide transporter
MEAHNQKLQQNLSRRTLRGALWLFSSAVTFSVLKILVISVLARLLSPKDFGLVAAATAATGFAEIFSQMGVGPSLVQLPALTRECVRTGFTLSILFGFAVGSVVWFSAPLIADFYRLPELTFVIRFLAINFPLRGMSVVSESLLKRDLRFQAIAIADILAFLIGYSLGSVILAITGFGYWALVLGILLHTVLRFMFLTIMKNHSWRPSLDRASLPKLLKTGMGFTTSTFFNYFALNGDYLVVGRWLGPQPLGLYSRSYNLMVQSVALFGNVITGALFPAMSSIQEERDRLRQAYFRAISFVSLVALPCSAMVFILAPEIIITILGSAWMDAILPFRILALGMYFRVAYKVNATLLQSVGAVYIHARREGLYAFLVISGSLIGQKWGIAGVATAVLVALASHFLTISWAALRHLSVAPWQFLALQFHGLCIALLTGLLTWGISSALNHSNLPIAVVLLTTITILLVVTSILLLWFPSSLVGKENLVLFQNLLDLTSKTIPRLSGILSFMAKRL